MTSSRSVLEQEFGGRLPPGLHVHHKNRKHADNRLENLVIVTPDIHRRIHLRDHEIKRKREESIINFALEQISADSSWILLGELKGLDLSLIARRADDVDRSSNG